MTVVGVTGSRSSTLTQSTTGTGALLGLTFGVVFNPYGSVAGSRPPAFRAVSIEDPFQAPCRYTFALRFNKFFRKASVNTAPSVSPMIPAKLTVFFVPLYEVELITCTWLVA